MISRWTLLGEIMPLSDGLHLNLFKSGLSIILYDAVYSLIFLVKHYLIISMSAFDV